MCPEEIRLMRQSLGLSQEKFAALAGVTWSTVSRWEHGRATPSPLALERLIALADKHEGDES